MSIRLLLLGVLAPLVLLTATRAQQATPPFVDAMRGPTPITAEPKPPLLRNAVNDDNRLPRNYSLQPPIIPHRVDGYQVTRDFNKCMDCHAREKTAFSLAVPVSPSHYIDRNGKVLDRISTRRYFCQQCHVAQDPVPPLVGNSFKGFPGDVPPAWLSGEAKK
jgi:cytochrome c-type protein NapB